MMCLLTLCGCVNTTPSNDGNDDIDEFPDFNQNQGENNNQNNNQNDNENQEEVVDPNADYLVSRIVELSQNKTYIEVDGKPYAIRGGQVRLDGLTNDYLDEPDRPAPLTDSEIELYFKTAKEIGLNTVEIPIEWRRVEPAKDQYDFSLVDKVLTMANNYDLKMELLWFSVNMCGDSFANQVPTYIFEDTYTYSRFTCDKHIVSRMYGEATWLIANDPDLMERETKALTNLMQHVHEWNLANGRKNPLIGVQVHNEADGMLRWRLPQRNLKYNGSPADPTFVWNAILGGLDNAGKAIKASKYKVYTRVNMTVTLGTGMFPEYPNHNFSARDVIALEGIDIVGDDAYNEEPTNINKDMKQYSINGNYPHIAENMGDYASSPSLFLTTYQAGGSYMFYDMATPEFFVYLNGNSDYHMNQGLLKPDLTYKDHTAETLRIVAGIKKMDSIIPLVYSTDFAAFNVKTKTPNVSHTQTICTSNIEVTYKTNNGGIAFAIEHDGYLYIYSTKDCMFSINNATYYLGAQIGYYNGEEFVVDQLQYLPYMGNEFNVTAEKLYRFKITEIVREVKSTTNENV